MKCLILLIGESFRLGGQDTRNRGNQLSYKQQINACKSHINFFEFLKEKYNCDVSVSIASYSTQYDNKIKTLYSKYLIYSTFIDNVIGLNNIFHEAYKNIPKLDFDFVLYLRIDIFLKNFFFHIFNPHWSTIRFPSVCWIIYHEYHGHPRINDTMLFIPRKYFHYLDKMQIGHENWYLLMNTTDLTYNDLDVMIDTYHDSDSQKDYNPLYRIVNRPETKSWHSRGHVFEKKIVENFQNDRSIDYCDPTNIFFILFIIIYGFIVIYFRIFL